MLCLRMYKDMQNLSSVFKRYIIAQGIVGSRNWKVAGTHGLAAQRAAKFPCHQGRSPVPACDILEGSAMQTVNIMWICITLRRWLIAVDLLTMSQSTLNALFFQDFAAKDDQMTRFWFCPVRCLQVRASRKVLPSWWIHRHLVPVFVL